MQAKFIFDRRKSVRWQISCTWSAIRSRARSPSSIRRGTLKRFGNTPSTEGYEIDKILITHYHPDHLGGRMMGQNIEGAAKMLEQVKAKVYVNKHEADGVKQVAGLSDSDLVKVDAGDTVKVGDLEVKFLHTPGHTPGSQCFLVEGNLISGDTLFVNSCGRVDLPGSDPGSDVSQLERHAAQSRRLDGGLSGARIFVGIVHHDRRPEASQHVHAISDARRFSRRHGLPAPLAANLDDGR